MSGSVIGNRNLFSRYCSGGLGDLVPPDTCSRACNFYSLRLRWLGDLCKVDLPDSIPNSEVKGFSVDDSCGATYRENKSLPGHLSSKNCKAPNFFRYLFTEVSSGAGLSAEDDNNLSLRSRTLLFAKPHKSKRLCFKVVVGQPTDMTAYVCYKNFVVKFFYRENMSPPE